MPSSRALNSPYVAANNAAAATEYSPGHRSLPPDLPITFQRYLRWLVQLQTSLDAVCDDAYIFDRLTVQGVLPLHQRSVPPTAAQVGLKAAIYELLAGATEREHAELLKARQQHRAWKLTGVTKGPPVDKKAATFSHFRPSRSATMSDVTAGTSVITHNTTPPCPCRVFLAQQRTASSEQRSRSSEDSSEKDENDKSDNVLLVSSSGGASHRKSNIVMHAVAVNCAASSTPGSQHGSPRPSRTSVTSALSASFPIRLKDTVRTGSCTAMEQTMPACSSQISHTAPSASGASSPREHRESTHNRFGSTGRPTDVSQAATPQLLLPVTAMNPVRALSAATISEEGNEGDNHGNDNSDDELSQKVSGATSMFAKTSVGAVALSAAVARPIPVGSDTMPSRALHSFWTHVVPEDVRRCSLCSGQLLLQDCWHALYLLQLLTMLSAALSMAAPLPLPPPTVLKTHPVEAMLLLFQTAQRCFVAGLALTSAVSMPLRPPPSCQGNDTKGAPNEAQSAVEHTTDVSTSSTTAATPSALEVLCGAHNGATAARSPVASASLASPTLNEQQRLLQSKENQLLCALAKSIIDVVDAVGCVAAPMLWPHKPAHGSCASPADSAVTPQQSSAGTESVRKYSLLDWRGHVLALRSRIFYGAFLVLMAHDGADKGAVVLVDASLKIVQLLTAAQGAPPDESVKASRGGLSAMIYLNISLAFALLTDCRGGSATRETVESHFSASSGDDLVVLYDDLRALCCVMAMLAIFADLVRAREVDKPSYASSAASGFSMPDSATHLIDAVVYPALVALHNSSLGNCSAQARPLLALWWLIRAETVRQLALAATEAKAMNATVRVLEQEVILVGDNNDNGRPDSDVLHWSAWLKESSRAAARASNAANEFLGLTFRAASLSGFSSPLVSPTRDVPLRWRLPVDVPTQCRVDVACLPLAWVRMWLLLCPPLFHISPANALALRHTIQQQQQLRQQQKLTSDRNDGAAACKEEESPAAASTLRASKVNDKVPQRRSKSHEKFGYKGGESAERRPKAARPDLSSQKREPTAIGKHQSNSSKAKPPPELSPAESHLRNVDALQQQLQFSTEPIYFWTRWCQVFLPDPPPPASSLSEQLERKEGDGPSERVARAAEVLSPVATAVSNAVAILRNPSRAWAGLPLQPITPSTANDTANNNTHCPTAPLPRTTQLLDTLQSAFPLLLTHEMVGALEAQSQLFLTSGIHTTAAAMMARSTPSSTDAARSLFVSYSFVSSIAPLREVVSTFHHNLQIAASAAHLSKSPSSLEEDGTVRTNVRYGSSQVASQPSPLLQCLISPSCVALPTPADDDFIPTTSSSSPLKPDSVKTVRQPARAGTKRPPLTATRTLPRRVIEEGKPSVPLSATIPCPSGATNTAATPEEGLPPDSSADELSPAPFSPLAAHADS
ncbi:hypothetical protein ABL78_6563 [Leptomonas seymouri]|uniref:Uncharacterized protein n=1 Tax=Leptomonas seymouri TaxID=5684 RepID=A0A0N1II36_LEPSE|nr:hypothetical protein ABL78_6563 [Leptomonas seymouri]|eukprot:KPI84382.1 hypothetical protein ABL78_6563 [Leptomonas seymouri]